MCWYDSRKQILSWGDKSPTRHFSILIEPKERCMFMFLACYVTTLSSAECSPYCVYDEWIRSGGSTVTGKYRRTWWKACPVPFYVPQFPHRDVALKASFRCEREEACCFLCKRTSPLDTIHAPVTAIFSWLRDPWRWDQRFVPKRR
jgi:hypothetical protein